MLSTHRWLALAFLLCLSLSGFSQLEINTQLYIGPGAYTYYNDAHVDFDPGGHVITHRQEPRGFFILGTSATVSGVGHHQLVDGYVRKSGSVPFVFPVGYDTLYAPVNVAPQSIQTIDAAYWRGTPPQNTQRSASLTALASNEYWHLASGGVATVTLSWRSTSQIASLVPSLDQLTIAAYNTSNQRWEDIASSLDAASIYGGSSTTAQGSVTTSSHVSMSAYSFWALGRKDACFGAVTATIAGDSALCLGATATLTASAGTAWQWSTGSTTRDISTTTAGTYTVTVTDGAGCTGTASKAITFSDCTIPDVISVGQPGCSGAAFGSVTLGNLPAGSWIIEQSGTTSQSYTGTGSTYTITGLAPGVYRFRVRNASGATSGWTPPFAVVIVKC